MGSPRLEVKLARRYDPSLDRQRLDRLGREFQALLHLACRHEPLVHGAAVTLRRRCGKMCCHCREGRPHETRVFLERRHGQRKVHPLKGPRARHLRKAAELHRRLSRLRGRLPALLAEVLEAWDRLGAFRRREGSRLYLQDRGKP